MYKPIDKLQHSFLDFNQPMGLHMNPDNRWVRLVDRIPWDEYEVKYLKLFPSDTGNVCQASSHGIRSPDHADQVPIFRP